jgi:hypothetical protein
MRADRLLKLASFLEENVKDENFNIFRWTDTCGTVLCAFGWATRIPEFQAEGLQMLGEDGNYGHPTGSYSEWRYPVYEGRECMDAAALFFDINVSDAVAIFSSEGYHKYVKVAHVVQRIRDYVKNPKDVVETALEGSTWSHLNVGPTGRPRPAV